MKAKSGVKIWMYPKSGKLCLSWHVYAGVELDNHEHPEIELISYQYVGEALENESGMTCVFPASACDGFEFIGFL